MSGVTGTDIWFGTMILAGVITVCAFGVVEHIEKQKDISFCTAAFNNPKLAAKVPNLDCSKVFDAYNLKLAPK